MRGFVIAGLSLGLFGAVTVAHAQTVVGSTFNLGARANANNAISGGASSTLSQSQGATLNAYNGNVSVTHLDPNDSAFSVFARSEASAAWTDSAHGTFAIRDTGWTFNSNAGSYADLNTSTTGLPMWTYTFISTFDGTFDLNYNVFEVSGNPFGLQGLNILWSGPEGDLFLSNAITPAAVGSMTRQVLNGQQYTVGITNSGNVGTGANTLEGRFGADIDWSITPVPEPFSILGLLAGVGAVVARKRRKS